MVFAGLGGETRSRVGKEFGFPLGFNGKEFSEAFKVAS